MTRQLAMVIDLNKCIGCQTCTVACKRLWTDREATAHMWWNIVNTMPGEGTPKGWERMGGGFQEGKLVLGHRPSTEEFGRAWEFNYDEVLFEGGGVNAQLRPQGPPPRWGPNWDEDQGAGVYPNGYYFYLPRICNHCSNPACLPACPAQAIFKIEENGTVLIDEDRCHGFRLCQEACPYKRIYFNETRNIGQKCILCFPRVERGVAPACVRQCPGRARHFGYLDATAGQVHALVKRWRVALPLHPEFETEPNIYYVPPILPAPLTPSGEIDHEGSRVPIDDLRSLFGPEVERALAVLQREKAKKAAGEPSEVMDILISRRWRDMMHPFNADPAASASE